MSKLLCLLIPADWYIMTHEAMLLPAQYSTMQHSNWKSNKNLNFHIGWNKNTYTGTQYLPLKALQLQIGILYKIATQLIIQKFYFAIHYSPTRKQF